MRGRGEGEDARIRAQGAFSASSVMRLMTLSTSKTTHGFCCCSPCRLEGRRIAGVGEQAGGGRGERGGGIVF